LLLCLLFLGTDLLAQNKSDPTSTSMSTGRGHTTIVRPASQSVDMLDQDEGAVLVHTALGSHRKSDSRLDCSHLVHAIYSRAGLPYAYASSADLYAGTDSFHRVIQPQAGDLVVWPGHVGVVVSPAEHSFFSKLRSGLGIDFYDGPYWKRRGKPRFLRYEKVNPSGSASSVAQFEGQKKIDHATPKLLAISARIEKPSIPVDPPVILKNPSQDSSNLEFKGSLRIHSKKPSPDQLRTAILSRFDENGEQLRSANVFALAQPLSVVDELKVAKVHFKGDHGWVDVHINVSSSITEGRPDFKKRSEHQRWGISRFDPENWEIALPPESIYIPRDSAAQLFAQQLATLTQTSPSTLAATHQKADLARLLNALLVQ